MFERRLIQTINQQIKLCNKNDEVIFTHNYNGKLKVAVEKIYFSRDCFNKVLDISSKDLLSRNVIYFPWEWSNCLINGKQEVNLMSMLTNIHFNHCDYVHTFGDDRSVYVYQPTHLEFKKCNFVNEIKCTIYLRDIANNIIFEPKCFAIELIFSDDPSTFIDSVI